MLDVRGRDVPGCPVVKTVLPLHSLNWGTVQSLLVELRPPCHMARQKNKKIFLRKEGGEGMSQAVGPGGRASQAERAALQRPWGRSMALAGVVASMAVK